MNRAVVFAVLLWSVPAIGAAAPPADPLAAEREAVWNSPEMLEARAWLETYFKASKKISAREGAAYLERLHASSPDGMRKWLADFRERRAQRATSETQAAMQREWQRGQALALRRQATFDAQQARAATEARIAAQVAALSALQTQPPIPLRPPTPPDDYQLYGFPSRTLMILNFLDTQAIREELASRRE